MSDFIRNRRYLMPAVFGPTRIPDRSEIPRVHTVSLSFETDPDALAALVPSAFRLVEPASVMVSRITYDGVDYIGGRSYSETLIGANCIHEGDGETLRAPYMLVLWVSDALPMISGREFMGHAKIMGEMTPIEESDGARAFSLTEYGAPLLEGRATDLVELDGAALDKARAATRRSDAFGWKVIQSAEGPMDAAYPVVNVMRWSYERIWSGRGELRLFTPDHAQAPTSSDVMAALAALPVLRMRRSFVGVGSVVIDRLGTRRLGTRASAAAPLAARTAGE